MHALYGLEGGGTCCKADGDLLQVVVVSATMPNDILELTRKFMTDPVRVLVKRDELTLEV